ncbi:MAG TPA: acetate kinase [Polyangiales bacterium]|nr:acetate kinase [Polyangiales bacterium]
MTTAKSPHVLVVNCGSSSLKLALVEPKSGAQPWQARAERLGEATATLKLGSASVALDQPTHECALEAALKKLPELPLCGVGHRVVHGGEAFSESAVLDQRVIQALEACSDLAPLHNPANLTGIRAAMQRLPELGQVAVFDTSFHHTMPAHAHLYAIPYALYEQHKVRRYGFHGTSHRYVATRAAELLGEPISELNLLTAHLGNGVSAAAVAGGRSVDTTMGFTPLEGLVMGTRSGDVDPNLHQFLVKHAGMSLDEVTDLLNEQSGLRGLSGESNDMRNLLQLASQGHARAALAIEVFCYRLAKGLLGLCAGLPSLDALVFTGGIGENAARVRELTAARLGLLGATLDAERNAAHGQHSNGSIAGSGSRIAVLVIPTHEELEIARETQRLLAT